MQNDTYLKRDICHSFSQVVSFQAIPVVQMLSKKHTHLKRNCIEELEEKIQSRRLRLLPMQAKLMKVAGKIVRAFKRVTTTYGLLCPQTIHFMSYIYRL